MRILFVDDNLGANESVEYLQRRGYEVVFASSSKEGYEKIQQERFDVVVIDGGSNMAVRGKLLSLKIREEFPSVMRICYTGTVTTENLDRYMQFFDGVVSRLKGISELEKTLEVIPS